MILTWIPIKFREDCEGSARLCGGETVPFPAEAFMIKNLGCRNSNLGESPAACADPGDGSQCRLHKQTAGIYVYLDGAGPQLPGESTSRENPRLPKGATLQGWGSKESEESLARATRKEW